MSVVPAKTGPMTTEFSYAGVIDVKYRVDLAPKSEGRVAKYLVDLGSPVKAGQVLVQLDRADLDASVRQAKANLLFAQARLDGLRAQGRPEAVAAAQAAVDSARARLREVQAGATNAQVKAALRDVANAQARYDRAVANYNHLTSPTPDEIQALKAQLDNAKAALDAAQNNYDRVAWEPDISGRPESVALAQATNAYQVALAAYRQRTNPRPEDIQAAQKAVDSAKAQLTSAQANLAQVKGGATAQQLQVAQANLNQAEETLALTKKPNSPTDLKQAEAQVTLDEARLESATLAAAEAQVVAPFDGVVAARLLSDGAITGPSAPVLTLVSQKVDVIVQIEENNLPLFKAGQRVDVIVPAYHGQVFPGKVTVIAPVGDARTHQFALHVDPEDPRGLLHGGMLANVRIHTSEQPNAVLVPQQAVIQRDGKSYVYVVVNGKAVARQVNDYLSDGNNAAIPSGVRPAEPVIVSGLASLRDGDPVRVVGQQPEAFLGGQGGPAKAAAQP